MNMNTLPVSSHDDYYHLDSHDNELKPINLFSPFKSHKIQYNNDNNESFPIIISPMKNKLLSKFTTRKKKRIQ